MIRTALNTTKTGWFKGHVKPRRAGVYETYDRVLRETFFNFWDGKRWHGGWRSVGEAAKWGERKWCCDDPVDKWRGLSKRPR